jgi:hypothetical protein
MTTTRLTRDDNLALVAEEVLTSLILDADRFASARGVLPGIEDEDGPVEVNVIETYAEQGLLASDKGLVVKLSDGGELHLTITAYTPTGGPS